MPWNKKLRIYEGKLDLTTRIHREWFWWVSKLFNKFDVVSFDNLGLEQLNIRRFFNDEVGKF